MDCHINALHARVFPQHHRGNALCHRLDELAGLALDDAADLREDVSIIDRLPEVILLTGRPQIELHRQVDEERLPLLTLLRQAAVVAVKLHMV